jgi:Ribonuclease G/E
MGILLDLENTHIGIPLKEAYAKIQTIIIDNEKKTLKLNTAVYGCQKAYESGINPFKTDHFEFDLNDFESKLERVFEELYGQLKLQINLDKSDTVLKKALEGFKNKIRPLFEENGTVAAYDELMISAYEKLKTIKDPHFPDTDYTGGVDVK